jgi:hypothetical protein
MSLGVLQMSDKPSFGTRVPDRLPISDECANRRSLLNIYSITRAHVELNWQIKHFTRYYRTTGSIYFSSEFQIDEFFKFSVSFITNKLYGTTV